VILRAFLHSTTTMSTQTSQIDPKLLDYDKYISLSSIPSFPALNTIAGRPKKRKKAPNQPELAAVRKAARLEATRKHRWE
jgi:hypothetical protein